LGLSGEPRLVLALCGSTEHNLYGCRVNNTGDSRDQAETSAMTLQALSWQQGSMVDCGYWINSSNEPGI